jgi:hypothetical protein
MNAFYGPPRFETRQRVPFPSSLTFKLQAKNGIAFAKARRMAYPVVRPADGRGDEKDLAATDF